MALRTFRSNPSLGGFGGEHTQKPGPSKDPRKVKLKGKEEIVQCDAFAQIIKELVDNAVDACSVSAAQKQDPQAYNKRVRVVLEKFEPEEKHGNQNITGKCSSKEEQGANCDSVDIGTHELLRVTVTDNGCGMGNIQDCVDAFRSSKAQGRNYNLTAGRYGIGLTLCLLHAQRLVPNSCSSIKSATSSATHFTLESYVVDTEGDSIRCVRQEQLPKPHTHSSGTAVSILVPGGPTAQLAWPRLAEYFARFRLSLGMQCSLEVMAPMLSKVPLFVRPPHEQAKTKENTKKSGTSVGSSKVPLEENWRDYLDDCNSNDEDKKYTKKSNKECSSASTFTTKDNQDDPRIGIQRAAQLYLERSVDLKNVAHSVGPIQVHTSRHTNQIGKRPQLEVDMVVYSPDDEYTLDDNETNHDETTDMARPTATMVLVRMVNRIPLLDSTEASSCGLVRGLAPKRKMWNSFGLEVAAKDCGCVPKMPTFEIRDSDQVAPFFQNTTHSLFEDGFEEKEVDSNGEDNINHADIGTEIFHSGVKRGRSSRCYRLLPAHIRLGCILLIIQIHSDPSSLPLPTLSKGCLPVDNIAIDKALEVGVLACLRSLQRTNPILLLTAQQLRKTERDVRYIPALSAAISSIISKSSNLEYKQNQVGIIQAWDINGTVHTFSAGSDDKVPDQNQSRNEPVIDDNFQLLLSIGTLIENRLRQVVSKDEQRSRSIKTRTGKTYETEGAKHETVGAKHIASPSNCVELDEFLENDLKSLYSTQSKNDLIGTQCHEKTLPSDHYAESDTNSDAEKSICSKVYSWDDDDWW